MLVFQFGKDGLEVKGGKAARRQAMQRAVTSRLASKAGIRNAEIVVACDAVGRAVDRAIVEEVTRIAQYSGQAPIPLVMAALQQMPARMARILVEKLAKLASWSHKRTAVDTLQTLTTPYRAWLLRLRNVRESADVLEDDPTGFTAKFGDDGVDIAQQQFDLSDYINILFPPPSQDDIERRLAVLVSPVMAASRSEILPQQMAVEIAAIQSLDRGNFRKVAKALMPYFQGSRARAMRTARTYGMFSANAMHREISDGLGDIVAGRQVTNPGGENARPDHALRSGTIYYKHPKPGQWGYDVMPTPPYDTGRGPHEDGGGLKWNCRCGMHEVLQPLPSIRENVLFQSSPIPDQLTYEDWWAGATEAEKKAAVGVRRYELVQGMTDGNAKWADFVNSKGRLLKVSRLASETAEQRRKRAGAVADIIKRNRKQRSELLRFGFVG